jgi:YD repeat-containing protein
MQDLGLQSLRRSVTGAVSGLYGSETTTYGDDTLDRLTSANSPSAPYGYAYDGLGSVLGLIDSRFVQCALRHRGRARSR